VLVPTSAENDQDGLRPVAGELGALEIDGATGAVVSSV